MLDDIQFVSTGSYSQPSVIITIPTSGSQGTPILIEAQTSYYVKTLISENIIIF